MSPAYRPSLRTSIASLLLSASATAFAIDTTAIISSATSTDCLEYRVVGICFWLRCSIYECSVETSVQVRHYVPDAVVSSYSNTGENAWTDVAFMSPPNSSAENGGDGTIDQSNENDMAKFKNADVIGHHAAIVFGELAEEYEYICPGAGTAFVPYLLSTLDSVAWRHNLPEKFYPESLTPGRREVDAYAVARAAAGCVLVAMLATQSQGHALGRGARSAGGVSAVIPGQRVAAAS